MSNSVAFTDVVRDVTGGNPKVKANEYVKNGILPVVDQGKAPISGYTSDFDVAYRGNLPCVVFGDHTKAIKYVDFPFALGADGVKVLSPSIEGLDVKFLFHYLKSRQLPDAGYSRHFKFLKEIEIPLPPLEEQRRIVALLDRAAEIRRRAEAARDKARAIIPALFVDMFGDPATNPMGWDVVELGEVAKLSGGGTPSKSNKAYWNGSIPWVSPKDMKFDLIEDSQDKITEDAVRGSAVKLIPPQAVLIVVRGMILAHTVPISMNTVPVTLNQDMKAIIPSNSVDPFYLRWCLQVSHSYLLSKVESSAHGTRKLETPLINGYRLPVPPLAMQEQFSAIAALLAMCKRQLLIANKLSQDTQAALSAEVFA